MNVKRALHSKTTTVIGAAAVIALVGGGAGFAGTQIGSADIKDNSIQSVDIKDGGVQLRDIGPYAQSQLKGQRGPAGPTGPRGAAGSSTTTRVTSLASCTATSDACTTTPSHFIVNSSTVALTPDGVQFGPYADGGSSNPGSFGSVCFTGLDGAKLSSLYDLAYYARYTTDGDTGGGGVPYFRIFLGDDGTANPFSNFEHDLVFSPNTQTPDADVSEGPFHLFVPSAGTLRYDDDPGGTNPDLTFAAQVAAHGDEVIADRGICVSEGANAGTNLSALLRSMEIRGRTFDFTGTAPTP